MLTFTRFGFFALLALSVITLAACGTTPSQNQFNFTEAGKGVEVQFGTVVDKTPTKIQAETTGGGALAGGLAGAGAGSAFGKGDGQAAALIAGAVIGAVAGEMAESSLQNRTAWAYTITTEKGKTLVIPQYDAEGDRPINVGDRVMIQMSGDYQRVLPATQLPEQIKRPKSIQVVD